MEDVLTEAPPPSRFLDDDLDNFAAPNPPLPAPLLLSNPKNPRNQNLDLLILLISPSSLFLLPKKTLTLASSLILPELPLSRGPHIDIYGSSPTALIAAVTCRVAPARAKPVARLLMAEFPADRVLVFDSIRPENFRGRLDAEGEEEAMVFKMETTEERRACEGSKMVKGVGWLGSGSLVEGLGAAVMGECEMRRRKGALVAAVVGKEGRRAARVFKRVMTGLGIEVADAGDDVKVASWQDSDLYT